MSTALEQQAATLPAAGSWQIDPSHSTVDFVVRHLMVSKVRGRFGTFSGVINVDGDPDLSSVAVEIEAASIDTGDEQRDAHLRSGDFLDVETYPTLAFRSTSVHGHDADWKVSGELTVHGVTLPVVLDVEYLGTTKDPWGGDRAGFSATTEIDREDFGMTWNQALEAGGVLVGKKVRIEIEVEAVKAA